MFKREREGAVSKEKMKFNYYYFLLSVLFFFPFFAFGVKGTVVLLVIVSPSLLAVIDTPLRTRGSKESNWSKRKSRRKQK